MRGIVVPLIEKKPTDIILAGLREKVIHGKNAQQDAEAYLTKTQKDGQDALDA